MRKFTVAKNEDGTFCLVSSDGYSTSKESFKSKEEAELAAISEQKIANAENWHENTTCHWEY